MGVALSRSGGGMLQPSGETMHNHCAEQVGWVPNLLLPVWSQNYLCQISTLFCATITVLLQHEPHVLRAFFCLGVRSITVSAGRGQRSSLEDPVLCGTGSWERSLPHKSQGSRGLKRLCPLPSVQTPKYRLLRGCC